MSEPKPVTEPGRSGHGRPQDDDARQCRARAEPIGQPSARHLEEPVREGERAEDVPDSASIEAADRRG